MKKIFKLDQLRMNKSLENSLNISTRVLASAGTGSSVDGREGGVPFLLSKHLTQKQPAQIVSFQINQPPRQRSVISILDI